MAITWFDCGTCGQSCQSVYSGVPRCLRCAPSRWLVRGFTALTLLLTACDWQPFAAPLPDRPCHRVYADTIQVTFGQALDTVVTVGACHPE